MNEPTFQHKVKAFVEESGGEVKTVEIREALDLPDSIVKNALQGLVETGLLKRIKRKHPMNYTVERIFQAGAG